MRGRVKGHGAPPRSARRPTEGGAEVVLSDEERDDVVAALVTDHGRSVRSRARSGVEQVARLWSEGDGSAADLAAFCRRQFVPPGALDEWTDRIEATVERLRGLARLASHEARRAMDEDRRPLVPMDLLLADYAPGAHVADDLFRTRVAFAILLNVPAPPPEELLGDTGGWSPRRWAAARLAGGFLHRVPSAVSHEVVRVRMACERYVSTYDIHADALADSDGSRPWDRPTRLLAHWGLRDEIRGLYASPTPPLSRQRLLFRVCERMVEGSIPVAVVGSSAHAWDPVANTLDGAPSVVAEDAARYERLHALAAAERLIDPHVPDAPSLVARRLSLELEMTGERVEGLLRTVLASPAGERAAAAVRLRLGRPLEPFDVWYDGFKTRSAHGEERLDGLVARRWPDAAAFEGDLPRILRRLGFDDATAAFLAAHIAVDPARGSGHAMAPALAGDRARLRTRIPATGMTYKGFNIAMHELGHNVEQVFSTERVTHPAMRGVPNTAFTEAFAFVFQARDLVVLDLPAPSEAERSAAVVDHFLATRELAGVALVDLLVWRTLVERPDLDPPALRLLVLETAGRVWDEYFAARYGSPACPLLAVYQHAVVDPLYLPNYPLGRVVAFQIEEHLRRAPLGTEMERMCAQGRLTPDRWMEGAVGASVDAGPLLTAADEALTALDH